MLGSLQKRRVVVGKGAVFEVAGSFLLGRFGLLRKRRTASLRVTSSLAENSESDRQAEAGASLLWTNRLRADENGFRARN